MICLFAFLRLCRRRWRDFVVWVGSWKVSLGLGGRWGRAKCKLRELLASDFGFAT